MLGGLDIFVIPQVIPKVIPPWPPGTIPAAAVSAAIAALILALDFGFCEWGLTLRALGGRETLIIHSCFAPGADFGCVRLRLW